MDQDAITITDPNYREPISEKTKRELDEYSEKKLQKAEEKEQAMLEDAWECSKKRAERRKNWIKAIKKMFAKESEVTRKNEQNQR